MYIHTYIHACMHTYIYTRGWNGDSGGADIYIAADKELLSGEEKGFSDVCNSDLSNRRAGTGDSGDSSKRLNSAVIARRVA
jgi:hypothetical protein